MAGKRPFPCMNFHVDFRFHVDENSAHIEGMYKPLFSVNFQVPFKVCFLIETFSTLLTGKRAFSCMNFHVYLRFAR